MSKHELIENNKIFDLLYKGAVLAYEDDKGILHACALIRVHGECQIAHLTTNLVHHGTFVDTKTLLNNTWYLISSHVSIHSGEYCQQEPEWLAVDRSYCHIASGVVYRVIAISNADRSRDDWLPHCVTYVSNDGKVWTRPVSEFTPDKYELC